MIDLHATVFDTAPQHGPRPLPLFLDMLRSETAADADLRARALTGLQAYQDAARPLPPDPLPTIGTVGRARLRDAGGDGPPVIFVPSLINPPDILDFAPDASLVRWIAARGYRTRLVDWGSPGAADRDIDLAGHVERFLLPLIAACDAPPVLVGYCLGGTLALAAAACADVAGVATIAAPWRFSGYGRARAGIAAFWAEAAPAAAALGVMPMETLQAGFWRLDPARTIAKYAAFATMPPERAAGFVRLEDWANAGAPLPFAAARAMFEDCIAADLPGRGEWRVGGVVVDPLCLPCPAVEFVSLSDRIVPAATAAGLPDARGVDAGHVGMIVGSRARTHLWEPLADWIAVTARPR